MHYFLCILLSFAACKLCALNSYSLKVEKIKVIWYNAFKDIFEIYFTYQVESKFREMFTDSAVTNEEYFL